MARLEGITTTTSHNFNIRLVPFCVTLNEIIKKCFACHFAQIKYSNENALCMPSRLSDAKWRIKRQHSNSGVFAPKSEESVILALSCVLRDDMENANKPIQNFFPLLFYFVNAFTF